MSTYPPIPSASALVTLSHKNTIFSNEPLDIVNVKKVVVNSPYELVDIAPDLTSSIGTYAIEVDGELHQVFDVLHGRHYNIVSSVTYSTNSTTYETVLTIDYGSVLNVKELIVVYSVWSYNSTYRSYVQIKISEDGETWTVIDQVDTNSTTEVTFIKRTFYVSFRYLAVDLKSQSPNYYVYVRPKKIYIIK